MRTFPFDAGRDIVGIIDQILSIENLTDVAINGPGDIWIDRGYDMEFIGDHVSGIETADDVRTLAIKLALLSSQRLDDAKPICDAKLPSGARLNACLAPICLESQGAVISIRQPPRAALTCEQLISTGAIGPATFALLNKLVKGRANLLIAGATGAGKTTLLTALISLVPKVERIVCIEETREIDCSVHPHLISLASKMANVEGYGVVDLSELVRTSLRMRPDRMVVGECRGAEFRDMLMAFNTGHKGGFSTVHANSCADVPLRLVALGMLCDVNEDAVKLMAPRAFDAVIFMRRSGALRYVSEVATLRDQADFHSPLTLVKTGSTGAEKMTPLYDEYLSRGGFD